MSLALVVAGTILFIAGSNWVEQSELRHRFTGPTWPELIVGAILTLGGIAVFLTGLAVALMAVFS